MCWPWKPSVHSWIIGVLRDRSDRHARGDGGERARELDDAGAGTCPRHIAEIRPRCRHSDVRLYSILLQIISDGEGILDVERRASAVADSDSIGVRMTVALGPPGVAGEPEALTGEVTRVLANGTACDVRLADGTCQRGVPRAHWRVVCSKCRLEKLPFTWPKLYCSGCLMRIKDKEKCYREIQIRTEVRRDRSETTVRSLPRSTVSDRSRSGAQVRLCTGCFDSLRRGKRPESLPDLDLKCEDFVKETWNSAEEASRDIAGIYAELIA